jgi:chemotaxis family two-component system sensor kinase Cph1
MGSFSSQELELALRECAAEPIHQIGKIQPNGVLLVLSQDSPHTVLQASDNLAIFLNLSVNDVIGKSIASLLGEPANLQIEQLIQKLASKDTNTGKVNIIQKQSSLDLQAHLYASEGLLVLELAQDEDTSLANRCHNSLHSGAELEQATVFKHFYENFGVKIR